MKTKERNGANKKDKTFYDSCDAETRERADKFIQKIKDGYFKKRTVI